VVASGLYGHVLYTGLVGMGIAYFTTRKEAVSMPRRWGVAGALFLTAMLAHFLWNSPLLDLFPELPWEGRDWLAVLAAAAVKGVPLLIVAILMVGLARRREQRWIAEALATEIGRPGLHERELPPLMSRAGRRRARREARSRGGRAAARAVAKLQREQITLAMIAARVGNPRHFALVQQHEDCARLRARVDRLADREPQPAG
jgi:hypothetical protein